MRAERLRNLKKGSKNKLYVLLGVDEKKNELVIVDNDLFVIKSLIPNLIKGKFIQTKNIINDLRILDFNDLKNIEMYLIKYEVSYQIVYFFRSNTNSKAMGTHRIFEDRAYNYYYNRSYKIKTNLTKSKAYKKGPVNANSNNKPLSKEQIEMKERNTITRESKVSLHADAKTSKWHESDLSRIVRTDKSSLDSELADAKLHKKRSYRDKYIDDQPTSGEMWSARMNEFNK